MSQIEANEKKIFSEQGFSIYFCYDLYIWKLFQGHKTLLIKRFTYNNYQPNKAKWKVKMLWRKKSFLRGPLWNWPLTYKPNLSSLHNLNHRHCEVWARLDQAERRYAPGKDFYINLLWPSITLSLETWFKVNEHSLSKGTLWVRYKPDSAKWREVMPRTRFYI